MLREGWREKTSPFNWFSPTNFELNFALCAAVHRLTPTTGRTATVTQPYSDIPQSSFSCLSAAKIELKLNLLARFTVLRFKSGDFKATQSEPLGNTRSMLGVCFVEFLHFSLLLISEVKGLNGFWFWLRELSLFNFSLFRLFLWKHFDNKQKFPANRPQGTSRPRKSASRVQDPQSSKIFR